MSFGLEKGFHITLLVLVRVQTTKREEVLQPLARERIAKGQLPRGKFSRMWGVLGTGQVCSLCDKPIQAYQIEHEVE